MLRQVTENFGGIGSLTGAFVNYSRLILRHRNEFLVLARADLFQLLESLIVPLQVLVAKRRIVGGELAGIRAWIFLGNGGKFLNSVLSPRGFCLIEGFAGIVWIGGGADTGGVGFRSHVKRCSRLHGLTIDIKAPAEIADDDHHDSEDSGGENRGMRKNRLRAMLDRVVDLVLLQFLARNMFRHECSPAWVGILNRSTRCGQAALAHC